MLSQESERSFIHVFFLSILLLEFESVQVKLTITNAMYKYVIYSKYYAMYKYVSLFKIKSFSNFIAKIEQNKYICKQSVLL